MNKNQQHRNANEVLVKVENLSKKFCKDLKAGLWYGAKDLLSNVSSNTHARELRPKEFWAVKDVSFELRRGECLGLIGHNGAGKSTLLKILNGLINPDAGKVTIKGRVGSLIELGAGFNPILSGRENIYNNGAIIGLTRQEIDSKLEEIIDFAEIHEFIDMPVQHYSSGMKVRLGFAVAAQMKPDVLIIDEVLAVGDVGFRAKCFNVMSELAKSCAIIFVSHSMPLIGRICTTGILLKNGVIVEHGDINQVIYEYSIQYENKYEKVVGEMTPTIYKVKLSKDVIDYDEDLTIYFSFQFPKDFTKVVLHYSVIDQEMKTVYQSYSISDGKFYEIINGELKASFTIKNVDLTNGKYFINIGVIKNNFNGKNICRVDGAASFVVGGSKYNSFGSIVKRTVWNN
ncbi:ABC transporter ATP-binding protein [Aestuariibaculum sediminum]|uniref:ABC transporter ATP-binding protein n=1 Tax=Aestuariibaculum sediminum TaxID=2770637 RepID=A0A8J6UDR6_9FLAO|nr:ABC transporter ATP-binding protein [Aestuariibaculum sediminum]MBD0833084.1 ABC transporter ATP-binding protein [Aestuariibaculum sediminum]